MTSSPGSPDNATDEASEAGDLGRRQLLAKGLVAGTIMWAAPMVVSVTPAHAAGSAASGPTATSPGWKWSAAPPSLATVCSTGPAGNANRGTASFFRNCTPTPDTISLTITIVSGPGLTGANARTVNILQSNSTGTCLSQTAVGSFNSANNQAVTFGPIAVTAGATFFSMAMVQSGGGGTDTYTSQRVNLIC